MSRDDPFADSCFGLFLTEYTLHVHTHTFLPNNSTEVICSFKLADNVIQWINCDQKIVFLIFEPNQVFDIHLQKNSLTLLWVEEEVINSCQPEQPSWPSYMEEIPWLFMKEAKEIKCSTWK